jgi:predicted N-acetyltransferase YhbS
MSIDPVAMRLLTLDDPLDAFGQIVVDAYMALPGHPPEPEYETALRDVADRVRRSTVFGAFSEGRPVGCVTFVPDRHDPFAEDLLDGESSFRMLAVDGEVQGRGIGDALVRRCIEAASELGSSAVFVHSGTWMHAAHRLYRRHGFHHVPERDWTIDDPPITLLGFVRTLS